ncbi:MAG: helix-turn-helix domain-containing protein [Kiritimatiellia bacterium]
MKAALKILEYYASGKPAFSIEALARKTALPEPDVRTAVQILKQRGYLSETGSRKYRLKKDIPLL